MNADSPKGCEAGEPLPPGVGEGPADADEPALEVGPEVARGRDDSGEPTETELSPPPQPLPRGWKIHDFRGPRPLTEAQLQRLDTLHCKFAQSLSTALSVLVRTRVHVELTSVSQRTYFAFIHSMPSPTSLHVVHGYPPRAPLVLEMDLAVLLPMIERLLGGKGDGMRSPRRPPTRIEQRLAAKVAEKVVAVLEDIWAQGPDFRLDLAEAEHNPLLIQVAGPTEPTLVLVFEVTMGMRSGSLHLALPLRAFDVLLSRLLRSSSSTSRGARNSEFERERILRRLASRELTLTAELPSVPIRLQDVLTLRPGDLIDTQLAAGSEAQVRLDGKRVFRATPRSGTDRRAIQITRRDPE